MLYPRLPGGRGGGAGGAAAVSESSAVSSSSVAELLAAGASAGVFRRATVAGDVRAAGDASPISGAGGLIGAAAGPDATDGDATAGDATADEDISETGAGFSGGLGSG